ncbi:uncharacterized protein LOC134777753 [Penaeus indicus]|uniref:uncharacterized protein LOC134777753 n=1 Tax=Penaeus indicus TaxID=29960 RepID=UPI00300C540F
MEFGLSKCAKATFKRGKLRNTKNIVLDDDSIIKELDQEGTYKYLGVNEAIPVVTYSFNIINWNLSELQRLDSEIRKQFTCNRMLHPKSDVDRLYLPRSKGGQFAARANNVDVDTQARHQWFPNILHNGADPKCRFCEDKVETIDHIVSGCSILIPGECKSRHDRVGQYLHWNICNHFSIKTHSNWYEHHPEPVTEGETVTILWDFSIHTDRTIQANRPDIVIKDKKNNLCFLIDMIVPSDRNVSAKTFEKLAKYKDLEIEIEKMWHFKSRTIPEVIGALGLIKKGAKEYLEMIPGNPSLQEIQKIVLNSNTHVSRRALTI